MGHCEFISEIVGGKSTAGGDFVGLNCQLLSQQIIFWMYFGQKGKKVFINCAHIKSKMIIKLLFFVIVFSENETI